MPYYCSRGASWAPHASGGDITFNEGIQVDPGRASGGRGGGGIAAGGGIGGVLVVVVLLALGVDPSTVMGTGGGGMQPGSTDDFSQCTDAAAANTDVNCRIIATAESLDVVWEQEMAGLGQEYEQPGLVIFTGSTGTGCGSATSAVGPFYCPADSTVYIDSEFFTVLTDQFGASGGPLAQEYVVAHEFGHHIQNQLGVLGASQQDPSGEESGAVRVELMADCFAGVWAHEAATSVDPESGVTFLEPLTSTDIADALSAAEAVGDDRIQERAQGRVEPEAWTHGSSEQRQRWFSTGYETGDPSSCDTLDARDL